MPAWRKPGRCGCFGAPTTTTLPPCRTMARRAGPISRHSNTDGCEHRTSLRDWKGPPPPSNTASREANPLDTTAQTCLPRSHPRQTNCSSSDGSATGCERRVLNLDGGERDGACDPWRSPAHGGAADIWCVDAVWTWLCSRFVWMACLLPKAEVSFQQIFMSLGDPSTCTSFSTRRSQLPRSPTTSCASQFTPS